MSNELLKYIAQITIGIFFVINLRRLIYVYKLFGMRDSIVTPGSPIQMLGFSILAFMIVRLNPDTIILAAAIILFAFNSWSGYKLTCSEINIAYLRYTEALISNKPLPLRPDLAHLPLFHPFEPHYDNVLSKMKIFSAEEISSILSKSNKLEQQRDSKH